MIKSNLILLFVITALAAFSCKKDKHDSFHEETQASNEKKWIATTVAGDGRPFFSDGPALAASFRGPFDVAVNSDGAVYVADLLNHPIRKIEGGMVSTFTGKGRQDTINGIGTAAGYGFPCRFAFDAAGNLYTLDLGDARVRKITTAIVSTYAGTVQNGFRDGSAAAAQFSLRPGIVADAEGNIYVADGNNRRIRKINFE